MKKLTIDYFKNFKIFFFLMFFGHLIFLLTKFNISQNLNSYTSEVSEPVIKLKFLKDNIKNQIVDTLDSKLDFDRDKKAYLGKKNNTVDRQTKAQVVAKFNKGGVGAINGLDTPHVSKAKSQQKAKDLSLKSLSVLEEPSTFVAKNDVSQHTPKKGLKHGDKNSKGLSQSNDFVENVPLGDFTKLNTQEFKFYGFYNRIKEKLEQFWGRNIQEEAEKFQKSGRRMPASDQHVTGLVVVLDRDGKIMNVNIKSTSGVKELDKAAVDAFNEAGPFPNPPKDMLKNGIAIIEWGFVVNT